MIFSLKKMHQCPFQIADLYDLAKKWEATAETLPQVVDRLISLKDLHEQGKCLYVGKEPLELL